LNPNVFLAPKPTRPGYPPTLEQIKSAFPLPGKYHFRFKSTLVPGVDKGPSVWMDCTDDSQPVAVYKNSIIAKVTRISFDLDEDEDEHSFRASAYRAEAATTRDASVTASSVVAPPPRVSPPNQQHSTSILNGDDVKLINIFDEPHSQHSSSFPPSSNSSYGDLLAGLGDSEDPLLSMSHSGPDDHDFFGGATTVSSSSVFTSSAHDELLNMSAPTAMTANPKQQHGPRPPPPQQQSYNNVQQRNGSFAPMNIGVGPQQHGTNQRNGVMNTTQQHSIAKQPASAPSSGNRPKSGSTNVFDSFQDKQSPFADLGRLI